MASGYARRVVRDGVTVVSDGTRVIADLDTAGDEPLMLARALPGVPVLVGADRYLSGTLAERRLGATVHLLDDGFQHFALARDVDLLLVSEEDLADRPMPAGRLRERLDAARAADAALVTAGYESAAEARAKGSAIVLTTEKDAVRLAACDLSGLPIASVPLIISIEPAEAFRRWLIERIRSGSPSAIHNPQSARP